jgi:hypothetical protein
MSGVIGNKELEAALQIPSSLKDRITQYERNKWAANLDAPNFQATWKEFMAKLEKSVSDPNFNDNHLVDLIYHLSTLDTVELLEIIGRLNPVRQKRFLMLVNWIADESPHPEQKSNASSLRERLLMTYRLQAFPKIYSTARITRATQQLKNNGQ